MIAKVRKNGKNNKGTQDYNVYIYLGDRKKMNILSTDSKRAANRLLKNVNNLLQFVRNEDSGGGSKG